MKARILVNFNRRRCLTLSRNLGLGLGSMSKTADYLKQPTGLSRSWLLKFMNGEIDNPRVNSLDKLIDFLDEIGAD